MEIAASAEEKANYRQADLGRFLVFPEDRSNPVRMKTNVPYKWLQGQERFSFKGVAQPNEYYAFQLGVWAGDQTLKSVRSDHLFQYKRSESEGQTVHQTGKRSSGCRPAIVVRSGFENKPTQRNL